MARTTRGPGGSRRPQQRATSGRASRQRASVRPAAARPTTAAAAPAARTGVREIRKVPLRSRFTGRAAVLVLVLAVLTVSYASSLKAYFQQRSHLEDLHAQIASSQADIAQLESQKARWQDPAYAKQQARDRFGYLMPGETSYVVLGADGKPWHAGARLSDPATARARTPTAWWTSEWRSVQLAGNPPAPDAKPGPLKQITAPKQ